MTNMLDTLIFFISTIWLCLVKWYTLLTLFFSKVKHFNSCRENIQIKK